MSLALPDDPPLLPDLAGLARPRLRPEVPILWRSQTSVQLGADVIVDRVDRSLVAWMTSIDGLQSPQVIEESLTIPEHEAGRLVRALIAAGALDDAARIPDHLRWATVADRDAAAARFGAVRDTHRDLDTAFDITERRARAVVAVEGDGPLADAVREATSSAGLSVGDADPDLRILADAPHPDVPALLDARALDRPHLHVGAFGARAVVGPLVIPGRTSCLRCAHLHRRDADPAWPLVAVQWAQAIGSLRIRPADPLLLRLAADQAALLVRRHIDAPGEPGAWSGYALDLRLPDVEVERRERPPHPMCGCLWPSR